MRRIRPLLRLVLPLAAAYIFIRTEALLAILAEQRPAIRPLAMLGLAAGLLAPYISRWLIATLCYGICILSFRDAFHPAPLPPTLPSAIDFLAVYKLYSIAWGYLPVAWGILSLLAF